MLKRFKSDITAEKLMLRLALSWLIECVISLFLSLGNGFPEAFDSVSIVSRAAIILISFLMLNVWFTIKDDLQIEKFYLFTLTLIYFALSLIVAGSTMADHSENGIYRALLCAAVMAFIIYYCFWDSKQSYSLPSKMSKTLVIVAAAGLFAICAAILISRYLGYQNGRWDFGIFTQMFDNMRDSFSMVTTCERDKALSHFAVHISPIYYALFPIYYIFPSPVTLQISQAAIVTSAVIPLCLLCKHFGLSRTKSAFIAVIFALYPMVAGSSNYDFHENCFMLPFMLWLFYFIEKGSHLGIYIFFILTLMIKEDAAIPLAFIGLYLIISKKRYLSGSVIFGVSAIYFCICSVLLTRYGDGTLSLSHYGNFGDSVFTGMLKSVISAPFYFLSQCIDEDKLKYLIVLLLPLGAAPFMNRRLSPLILLCPIVLMNLVTDYLNQYSPYFYYNYAATAILFYLSVSNLSRVSARLARVSCIFSLSCVLLLSPLLTLPLTRYITDYSQNKAQYEAIDAVLENIPADSSISASEIFVPHLYEADVLYALPTKNKTEYAIIDLKNDQAKEQQFSQNSEYELVEITDDVIAVYRLKK